MKTPNMDILTVEVDCIDMLHKYTGDDNFSSDDRADKSLLYQSFGLQ